MKTTDFFPRKNADLLAWLNTYKIKVVTLGPGLGLLPGQITTIVNNCNLLIAEIQAVDQKWNEYQAKVDSKDTLLKTIEAALRADIRRMKEHTAYTPAIGKELGIVGEKVIVIPEDYKGMITVEITGGVVRIKFQKNGADGVNIYSRIKGDVKWKFLARDTNSPYDDHTELAIEGKPEVREYMAFGVIDDEQIGQPSDIVSITVG